MSTELKITTELLYRGTLIFALIDAIYIPLLVWRVNEAAFRKLKWLLVIAAALVWFGIWSWAIGNFWETVYVYVFPAWMERWLPWIAFANAGAITLGFWTLALRLKWNPVLTFCLLGGVLGGLTHIWAVYRGVVTKPPMLRGASPVAAVIFAVFEYILYWCTILVLANVIDWVWRKLQKRS
ncbi:MAG TPA: hypothetical protein VFQ13_11515 [Anaerolineales bacterium]|nr:hypothetical protein [Anaerolineales bacterium]